MTLRGLLWLATPRASVSLPSTAEARALGLAHGLLWLSALELSLLHSIDDLLAEQLSVCLCLDLHHLWLLYHSHDLRLLLLLHLGWQTGHQLRSFSATERGLVG